MPRFFVKKTAQTETRPSLKKTISLSEENESPVKTLLEWSALARPFRKKDRSYYTTTAIIVVLLVLIALLAQEILLVGVILALCFVAYVLAFFPPENLTYKISTQGITIGDHFYFWTVLDSFWFSEKEGQTVLHVVTNLHFPTQLMILLGAQKEEVVKNTVARYLPFHEIPPKSWMDHWAESLQKHFPLETPHR